MPVFADVDETTQNLTPATVEPCLTARTRAVILVDQAGVPADLDAIRALCAPRGITVVEDAACAAGSVYRGRPVGAGAELAAFSFHPRKLLTTGEGGMIVTPDEDVAARLRRLREHGMDLSAAARHASAQPVIEHYTEVGFNYRMTDIQAAIGLVQLGKLGQLVARRRALAQRYQQLLSRDTGHPDHHGPGLRHHELPVILGTAARGFPGLPRRTAAASGRGRRLGPAGHHGRSSRARIPGSCARSAAGD